MAKGLKINDTIKCKDTEDLIDTMTSLAEAGIETDFLYREDDVVLVVTGFERRGR